MFSEILTKLSVFHILPISPYRSCVPVIFWRKLFPSFVFPHDSDQIHRALNLQKYVQLCSVWKTFFGELGLKIVRKERQIFLHLFHETVVKIYKIWKYFEVQKFEVQIFRTSNNVYYIFLPSITFFLCLFNLFLIHSPPLYVRAWSITCV